MINKNYQSGENERHFGLVGEGEKEKWTKWRSLGRNDGGCWRGVRKESVAGAWLKTDGVTVSPSTAVFTVTCLWSRSEPGQMKKRWVSGKCRKKSMSVHCSNSPAFKLERLSLQCSWQEKKERAPGWTYWDETDPGEEGTVSSWVQCSAQTRWS